MPDTNSTKSTIYATQNPPASQLVTPSRQKLSVTVDEDAGQRNGGRPTRLPPKTRSRTHPLGQADRGAVAVAADGERARRGGRVYVRDPARWRLRNGRHERTGDLTLAVGHRGRQGREAAGAAGGEGTHVGPVDRDGRGERAGVGLGLGDASALLHVRVQRDGDGGQNADDRHDDQELDQREAVLTAKSHALLVPELGHVPSLGWLVPAVEEIGRKHAASSQCL